VVRDSEGTLQCCLPTKNPNAQVTSVRKTCRYWCAKDMPPILNPAPRHFHFEHSPPPAISKLSATYELPSLLFVNLVLLSAPGVRLVPRRDTGTEALVKQRSWPALKVELGEHSIIVDTAIEKGAVVWVDEEPFLLAFKRGLSLRRCCQHNITTSTSGRSLQSNIAVTPQPSWSSITADNHC
jgi:hypothetical protein